MEEKENVENTFESLENLFAEEGEIINNPDPIEKVKEVDEVIKDASETLGEDEVNEVESTEVSSDIYQLLRDFNLVPEMEKPDEETIRESLNSFGSESVKAYFESRPKKFQDFFRYQNALENPTDKDLDDFYKQYIKDDAVEIKDETVAREYLKNSPEFKALYDDADDMEEALDLLADKGKLITKATTIEAKNNTSKEADREKVIAQAEATKKENLESAKLFYQSVQEELEKTKWSKQQKEAALKASDSKYISNVWAEVIKNPKGFGQFANLLTYFKDGNFDSLYAKLEGKEQSKNVLSKEKSITTDTLGKLLGKTKQAVTDDWMASLQ